MPPALQNPYVLWFVLTVVLAVACYFWLRWELRVRAVLYGSFFIACLVAFWPPYGKDGQPGKIQLGLDLRGGMHLVLQVVTDEALAAVVDDAVQTVRDQATRKGIGKSGDQILVQIPAGREGRRASEASPHQRGPARCRSWRGWRRPGRSFSEAPRAACRPPSQVMEGRGHTQEESVFYLVRRQAVMTGRDLKTARVGAGEHGEPNVEFTLKPQGAARLQAGDRPQHRPPAGHRPGRAGDFGADDRGAGGRGSTDPRPLRRRRRPTSWPRSCARVRCPRSCATCRS